VQNVLVIYPRSFREFQLLGRVACLLTRIHQGEQQSEESSEGSGSSESTPSIEDLLFPDRPSPKRLLCLAMLSIASFVISDYGLRTTKFPEPVAYLLWQVGWWAGVFAFTAFLISLFDKFFELDADIYQAWRKYDRNQNGCDHFA